MRKVKKKKNFIGQINAPKSHSDRFQYIFSLIVQNYLNLIMVVYIHKKVENRSFRQCVIEIPAKIK